MPFFQAEQKELQAAILDQFIEKREIKCAQVEEENVGR